MNQGLPRQQAWDAACTSHGAAFCSKCPGTLVPGASGLHMQLIAVWLLGGSAGGPKLATAAGVGCSMHITWCSLL